MRRLLAVLLGAGAVVALLVGAVGAQPPLKKDKGKGKGPLEIERSAITGGIQWFATWESGLAEARRSGRPILLVSAAPHCAGVSGVW